MRTLLITAISILSVFTAIALACAVRIALRPGRATVDPYFHPIGDVPGFSAEQLLAISKRSMTRIEQDAQRRSFAHGNTHLANPLITREMVDAAADRIPLPELNSAGDALRTEADGVGASSQSPRAHAVRSFFCRLLTGSAA